MIGSALGDAIGELAFRYRNQTSLLDAISRSPILCYTDDTAMAIGLAQSLVKKGDIDQQHIGETFRRNYESEPWRGYASGPPTIFGLVSRKNIKYVTAAKSLFGGQGSLGNGAAMRIVPVGILFHGRDDLLDKARQSAEVTHAHPVGMDGATIQAMAISMAVDLDPVEAFSWREFIDRLILASQTKEIRAKMNLVKALLTNQGSPGEAARTIGRSVAVHESMPFAVFSFLRHPKSFESCLMCAVLNGGDRDTLGAMAGAISGAYLGIEAIPPQWISRLENRTLIEELAIDLHALRSQDS
ncbi:MAG: ADP-ribosylglycohydrolase family protein [Deltaproteobacteria bacterium]|nr:ADP-ribosylglycohydrolase family protein [Deltaproteobacteria bacterium]